MGKYRVEHLGMVEPLNISKIWFSSTSIGNYALFGAGDDVNSNFDAYDNLLTKSVFKPSHSPSTSKERISITLGDNAIFVGNVEYTKEVHSCDNLLNWNLLAGLSIGVCKPGVARAGNNALVAGGRSLNGRVEIVNYYTYPSLSRGNCANLNVPRGGDVMATTVDKYAIFNGGRDANYNFTYLVEIYDDMLTKTVITNNLNNCGEVALSVGDYGIFIGGSFESDTVETINKDLTIGIAPPLDHPKYSMISCSLSNYAMIIGGKTTSNGIDGTVELYDELLVKSIVSPLSNANISTGSATSVGNYALVAHNNRDVEAYELKEIPKALYYGVDDTARKAKKLFVGVDGIAKKVKKAYIGVDNKARLFYEAKPPEFSYHGTITPLTQARGQLAATSIGKYALFAGGLFATTSRTDTVDVYDVDLTNLSSGVQKLSNVLSDAGATSVGNYALFGGGLNSVSDELSNITAYDVDLVKTDVGQSFRDIGGRIKLGATTVGNYALFALENYEDVDAIDTNLTLHSTVGINDIKTNIVAGTVGNHAIFVGGANGSTVYKTADSFDDNLVYHATPDLSIATQNLASTSIGDYVLFAGGNQSSTYRNQVNYYTADMVRGVTTETLSATRMQLSATTVGDRAIFAGGKNSAYLATVDVYDAELTRTIGHDLTEAKVNFAATSVGEHALFAGGYTSMSNCFNTVDVYTYQ